VGAVSASGDGAEEDPAEGEGEDAPVEIKVEAEGVIVSLADGFRPQAGISIAMHRNVREVREARIFRGSFLLDAMGL
jgi:hypothetical protein